MKVNSDEMELAYSRFIDGESYDKAESALFDLIRLAFKTGWNAAKADNIKLLPSGEREK